MSEVQRVIEASPEQVWQVLSDGWLYPLWVVGATRMREVDGDWPQEGAKLHHSVGVWPAVVDDDTEVVESSPPGLLRLQARAWPSGEARVALHLEPHGGGTLVRIQEELSRGPGRLVPGPVRRLGLRWRNVESLRRLAFIAERRT